MGDMIESGTLPPGSGGADEAADALDGALGGLERKVPGGGAGLGPGGPFAAKRKLSAKDGTDVGGADVGGFGLLPGGRLSGAGRADIKGSGLQNKSPIMKPPAPVSDAQFDADLNGAVEFYRGISPRNLKDNRNGTIPDIEGKLEEHFSGMMEYYFEAVDPEGGPEEAAEWAFDEIKGRLPAALGKAGEKVLNIPSGDKTVSEYILKNLDEHFEANGGMDRLEEIAAGTDGYKRGLGKAENGLSAFTKRPEGDDRSAKEILEDNPILANLDPDDMERLGERVGGDPSKDADAAFLAASVLNRVERYTNDGKRITDSGGDAGNGKVDGYWLKGWSDKRKAKEGTEAARLEEFLEEGFSVFEGEDVPLDGRPPGGVAASGLSETTKRPPGDDRSAKEIKDDHPVLDELSGAEAKQLKFWFGDFDKNADAAYRAAAAIENVKRYDADGKPIYNEDVTSDKIEKGDERDRFERLLDEGPGALKGDGSWSDYHVTEKTEYDGDKSAKDILEDNSTWNALATPQRRALLELEPDLHTDPDAAHRATRALNHIQVWDKDGNSQAVTDDHRLKGFKSKVRDKDAKHDPTDPLNDNGIDWAVSSHSGTKARQFEDLIREGYGSLKGGPEANLNKEIAGAANTPFEAFKDAALRGDLDAMRDAMRDPDFDIDATADNGVGLIHVAAFADDPLQTVELLVEGGVDVAKLHEGANTLDTLEAKGHHDAADYLQDVLNSYLRQAVRDGNPGRAAELMAGGADPGAAANPNAKAGGGVSVLELAAVHDPEMARAMLEAMPEAERADVLNAPSADGNIAMHAIAASGDAELYEDAKDWGGDADVANRAGHTAEDVHDKVAKAIDEHEEEHGELKKRFFLLDDAIELGAGAIVLLGVGLAKLIDHLNAGMIGVPVEVPVPRYLDRSLGAAVRIGDADRTAELIKAGADPGAEMVKGVDMLLYAASQGDLDTIKAIVRATPPGRARQDLINEPGIHGMTPARAAADAMMPGKDPGPYGEVYDFLEDQGADLEANPDTVYDLTPEEAFEIATGTGTQTGGRPGAKTLNNNLRGGGLGEGLSGGEGLAPRGLEGSGITARAHDHGPGGSHGHGHDDVRLPGRPDTELGTPDPDPTVRPFAPPGLGATYGFGGWLETAVTETLQASATQPIAEPSTPRPDQPGVPLPEIENPDSPRRSPDESSPDDPDPLNPIEPNYLPAPDGELWRDMVIRTIDQLNRLAVLFEENIQDLMDNEDGDGNILHTLLGDDPVLEGNLVEQVQNLEGDGDLVEWINAGNPPYLTYGNIIFGSIPDGEDFDNLDIPQPNNDETNDVINLDQEHGAPEGQIHEQLRFIIESFAHTLNTIQDHIVNGYTGNTGIDDIFNNTRPVFVLPGHPGEGHQVFHPRLDNENATQDGQVIFLDPDEFNDPTNNYHHGSPEEADPEDVDIPDSSTEDNMEHIGHPEHINPDDPNFDFYDDPPTGDRPKRPASSDPEDERPLPPGPPPRPGPS